MPYYTPPFTGSLLLHSSYVCHIGAPTTRPGAYECPRAPLRATHCRGYHPAFYTVWKSAASIGSIVLLGGSLSILVIATCIAFVVCQVLGAPDLAFLLLLEGTAIEGLIVEVRVLIAEDEIR